MLTLAGHLHAADSGGAQQHFVVHASIGDHLLGVTLWHALCNDGKLGRQAGGRAQLTST